MRILVTGGAGFIGSHLVQALLERGDEVYVIDNLSTGSLDNLEDVRNNSNFHLIVDSILNESTMAELVSRCEEVYHLAAAVGVKLIMERPVETIETNVRGTEIVLKCCNKYKRKVMIASTSEIYGKHVEHTLAEDDNRVMGSTRLQRWAYACSKTLDEFLSLAYFREKRLPVIIARFFNTVGPRQTGQYGMVVPRFVQNALMGKSIHVYGDGSQSRSFIYVGDVVDGIIRLMAEPGAVGDIFNIGHEKEITISELAKKVKELTNSRSEIEYIPYEKAYGQGFEDMQRRTPNIGKIARLINFKPTLDIDDILRKVIDHFVSSNSYLPQARLNKTDCNNLGA